jgi:hypothetical protein
MRDDWRVHVRTGDEAAASELAEGLANYDLAHELGGGLHDRVAVSRDDLDVFLYTATRDQAEAAARAVAALAEQRRWQLSYELRRWHPDAERWEDPDLPLPASADERAAEHRERVAAERAQSQERGYPEFEVRVSCRNQAEARVLANRLAGEGIIAVQRWRFVVAGAADEDAADELAERLRAEAPPGSEVIAEGSVPYVVNTAPMGTPFNPFSVFGGLGG